MLQDDDEDANQGQLKIVYKMAGDSPGSSSFGAVKFLEKHKNPSRV